MHEDAKRVSMTWQAISARPYPEDEGWLCPLCDARVESFYSVNQAGGLLRTRTRPTVNLLLLLRTYV